MFKVGDKIKCIGEPSYYDDLHPAPKIGKIYTVEYILNDDIRIVEDLGGLSNSLSREFPAFIFQKVDNPTTVTVLSNRIDELKREVVKKQEDINLTKQQINAAEDNLKLTIEQIEELENAIKILEKN